MLRVEGISKRFGPVQALDGVSLELAAGQVHALVGENGAGKSTLSRIVSGTLGADAGQMWLAGEAYRPVGRRGAEAAGVRMVMQELNLIGTLSVAENIFLDALPRRAGVVCYGALHQAAKEVLDRLGLAVDAATPVERLSVGQQQLVEIAAGLSKPARVLILDEPTASLTEQETELLFRQIRRVTAGGTAVLYISHRMEEIQRVADRVTILRDGRVVSTHAVAEISMEEVVNRMVGRELGRESVHRRGQPGSVLLEVEGLGAGERVRDVSFELRRGEILGFAGLMGSGRTETMRAIFGADAVQAGRVRLGGREVRIRRPGDAVRAGVALLTEDRKGQGLFLPQSVGWNTVMTRLRGVSRAGVVLPREERKVAEGLIGRLAIRCWSAGQEAGTLSGGNQQKVVLAKWLYRDCEVLLCDEPTRGIDVGAKFEIYSLLGELADQGKGVVMVSSDLKELMAVCDRIAVMSDGRLVRTLGRDEFSEEAINAAAFSEYMKRREAEKRA